MKELYLIPKHLYDVMKPTKSLNETTNKGIQRTTTTTTTTQDNTTNNSYKPRTPNIGERWQTKIPPPPFQITSNKRSKIPSPPIQNQIRPSKRRLEIQLPPPPPPLHTSSNHKQVHNLNKNPNIYTQLSLRMTGKELQRATLILKHFDAGGDIKWNEYGDMYSPINGYNIIDIIHDLIYREEITNTNKLNDYKYIITSSSLPMHYIKNKFIKDNLIYNTSGGSTNKRKTQKGGIWISY